MISLATWILWLHLLAAAAWLGGGTSALLAVLPGLAKGPGGEEASGVLATARRAHFVTSRAMEILVLTGILNVVARGMQSGMGFSAPFLGMLSVKIALLLVMAGLQIWLGIAWKRPGTDLAALARRARRTLASQMVLGALAVLLGLGLRAV